MSHSKRVSHIVPNPELAVRTTVEIPEDLHVAAKVVARRRRCRLGEVFADGLKLLFASMEEGRVSS